ncbi:hypothetical protein WMW72_02085 [Paenibacillus filicis]|uniref:Lipoprotein n=1 Tax=Paenibacillus filicis TaxID=669464 RepID=A0ABU9DEJ5_9BACL
MNYTKIGAAGVLLTLLLSGCGTQAATQDTPKSNGATQGAAAQADSAGQNKPDRPQMNEQQREMMTTFQSLIRMDKTDGLAITKEEAQPMLAVVQDSITKGELTSDAHAKLTEKLTADQKKYLDDSAAKMKEQMDKLKQDGNSGGPRPGGQRQQGQAQGDANAAKPHSTDANAGNGASGQQDKGGQDRGQRGGGNGGGFTGGKNPSEQLVELLQAKLK